ncbi:small integral membrane protein 5-like isoform X1 [Rhinatrema bivittatum]|uniref:small integral membrane protein 5-like isoform X1 n=2 Tax=Rhinatrema bivittatum TaxID=194408 RepID=UPI00112ED0CC|nr:small integral membrane protein 5-like isoform X1 [Rhinatrema bivittatum]
MNNKIQDLVSRIEMASQNLSQDLKTIGQKFLSKIQELPQSGFFNIIAFTVLLLFIVAVLLMIVIACSYNCCGVNKKHRLIKVEPTPDV